MKVICSWCKRSMGEKMGPPELITHGICAACLVEIEKQMERVKKLNDSPTLAEVNARRGF